MRKTSQKTLYLEEKTWGMLDSLYVNLTQIKIIWEEGISIEKMEPPGCPVGKSVGYFLD